MRIEKPFDQLKEVFNDPDKVVRLIDKKPMLELFKRTNIISEIKISDNSITCDHNPGGKYTWNLVFNRTDDGCIEFESSVPFSQFLVLGGLLIFGRLFARGADFEGYFIGFLLLVLIYLLGKYVFNGFNSKKIAKRITERWDQVVL
jgi:hypothetical protein